MQKNLMLPLVLFLALQLRAQQYPDTIWIPVTFYDFHSDKSNPEFEQPNDGAVHLGMVANTLDADRKPVLGPTPYRNYYIAKWFRPWQAGDFTIPSYTVVSGGEYNAVVQYNGIITVNYDTAFKDIVIKDSLPFVHIGNGVYQYDNPNFFLLDGKGFGNEGLPHNYSFTMELHTTFTYEKGLIFNFAGDDDLWAFINGELAMDIGGVHQTAIGALNLDNNPTGMQVGKKYNFDLFYAERHTSASDIKITTNLFTPPGYLQLFAKPGTPNTPDNPMLGPLDSAVAGQPFTLYAHVFDSLYNWIPAEDNLVTWTMTDSMGNPVLTSAAGSSTSFTPTQAYGNVTITATFKDPNNPNKVITTKISVYIGPGPGTHIVIEADSLARRTRNDRPVGTITVDRTANVTVYAVVRDAYGNFVSFATTAAWSTANPATATATPLATRQWAASIAEKSYGNTTLTATEAGLTPGTALIVCTGVSGPVPVTATLLDTNGNGHLDRIDIVFPDSVSLAAALPTVQQWIQAMNIVSDDGGAKVTLTAVSMTSDGSRTIHVVLQENTGSTLETGWTSATITLSPAPVTADGRSAYVGNIIDGAEPVVKGVCFVPMPNADTLRVIFSEPVANPPTPLDPNSLIAIINTQDGSTVPISTATVVQLSDRYLYVFPGTGPRLSGLDSVVAGARSFNLELCGEVSIVTNQIAGGNPFNPRTSTIPYQLQGNSGIKTGTRIEVSLLPAVKQDLENGKVRATITILDAVGNVVINKKEMLIDQTNVRLFFIWDGKTGSGTFVAPGTYLARINVEDLCAAIRR